MAASQARQRPDYCRRPRRDGLPALHMGPPSTLAGLMVRPPPIYEVVLIALASQLPENQRKASKRGRVLHGVLCAPCNVYLSVCGQLHRRADDKTQAVDKAQHHLQARCGGFKATERLLFTSDRLKVGCTRAACIRSSAIHVVTRACSIVGCICLRQKALHTHAQAAATDVLF